MFRLYRGWLVRRSQVMNDMFNLPAPSPSSGPSNPAPPMPKDLLIDNTMSITLSDDPSTFALMLDILIPQILMTHPLHVLVSVLPLADKYEFDDLKRWILEEVDRRLPKTIKDLDADPTLAVYDDLITAAAVINASRLPDLSEVLPLAFYALATKDWAANRDSSQRALACLSAENQIRLRVGCTALQKETITKACSMPENGILRYYCAQHAPNGSYCARGTSSGSTVWATPDRFVELLRDPLKELEARVTMAFPNVCSYCTPKIASESKTARLAIFSSLSQIFQL